MFHQDYITFRSLIIIYVIEIFFHQNLKNLSITIEDMAHVHCISGIIRNSSGIHYRRLYYNVTYTLLFRNKKINFRNIRILKNYGQMIIIRFIYDASGLLANSHRKSCLVYINSDFVLLTFSRTISFFLYSEKN